MGVKCCCLSKATIDKLNEEITRLSQLITTYKTQYQIEQGLRSKMQLQRSTLRKKDEEGTLILNQQINLQRQKESKIYGLKGQNGQMNLTIQNLHKERDSCNNRIIETNKNIESLRKQIQECSLQINDIGSFQQLKQEKNQKSRQLQRINMQFTIIPKKLKSAQQQCQQLTSKLKMLQKLVGQLRNKKQRNNNQSEERKENQYLIQLTILENKKNIKFTVQGDKNISQVKQIIYQQYYSDLLPALMAIIEGQSLLNLDQQIRYMFPIKRVKLRLRKAHVWELDGFINYPEKEDEASLEKGVVKMSCDHCFSRSYMRGLIDFQLEKSIDEYFRCNLIKNNTICNNPLQANECILIGGYTAAEWDVIQNRLNEKYLKKYSQACPSCKFSNSYANVKMKKVLCNQCKQTHFCYPCGEAWAWKGDSICKSQTCKNFRKVITNSPHQRCFQVYRQPNTNDRNINIYAPKTRACPTCKAHIDNVQHCKHTHCIICGQSFCFICLSKCLKGEWSCGGAYQQCKLAPNQTLDDLMGK